MILHFEGVVESTYETVLIDGRNVIEEIHKAWPGDDWPTVTVALGDERFTGDLDAWEGLRGWSEWTPGALPVLKAGEHDVWDRLDDLEGQEVQLWISDEPVNTLDAAYNAGTKPDA